MPLKPPPITLPSLPPRRLPPHHLSKPSPTPHQRPFSTYGYTQAKALVYAQHGSPRDVLSLHTHSLPPPHSTLLTLRTLASPLNPADINTISGTYPSLPSFTTTLGTPHPTAVPGSEGAFEVLSAGSAVRSVKKGDWVIPRRTGLGTWRTHVQVREEEVMRVDREGLSAVQVGGVSVNPVTAYRLLKDFVALGEGEWYVQNGANSAVGRAVLQLGKRWGMKGVAVVRDRKGEEGEVLKRELEDLGAECVVTESEVGEKGWRDKVLEMTNGGVRLALNCVGGESAMGLCKVLREGGTMVTYGAMGRSPLRVGAGMLIFRDLRFRGFWVSRWGDANAEEKRRTVDEILGLIREGAWRDVPVVEVPWGWGTERERLVEAVEGTLEGFRKGKGVFMFGDT